MCVEFLYAKVVKVKVFDHLADMFGFYSIVNRYTIHILKTEPCAVSCFSFMNLLTPKTICVLSVSAIICGHLSLLSSMQGVALYTTHSAHRHCRLQCRLIPIQPRAQLVFLSNCYFASHFHLYPVHHHAKALMRKPAQLL